MAYVDTYSMTSTNRLTSLVKVIFAKKDGDADEVINYVCQQIVYDIKGAEGKFTPIFGGSINLKFLVKEGEHNPWTDFAGAQKDTWKVRVLYNGVLIFSGYLLPDEGAVPLRDLPYSIEISAVDGIGLLKDIALTQPDGSEFDSHHSIMTYIAACLYQTGLDLPIRVIDNVFHASFNNRDINYKWDFFSQAYLEYRTFRKDAVTFTDCYNTLEIILSENYRMFQWKGEWVIIRLGMMQYTHFVAYYTMYDANGENPVGYEYGEAAGTFGKHQLIFPINQEQRKSMKLAPKSTKTFYNYIVWPEIPKNNKYERGTEFRTGTTGTPAVTFKDFDIPDWIYGRTPTFNDFEGIITTENIAYRRSTYDSFAIEKSRVVTLEKGVGDVQHFLRSEGLPVIEGDRISVSVDHKRDFSDSGTYTGFYVVLRKTGSSDLSWLDNLGNWRGSGIGGIEYTYGPEENINQWHNYSVTSIPIPFDGAMYIMLTNNTASASISYYQNLNVEYKPYVAGGYLQVKGDYWITEQTANYPDKASAEVYVSDNLHKIYKGCLLNSAGIPLTADWYRMGLSEHLHYKQITNISRFNMDYRRMLLIEGPFKGLMYAVGEDEQLPIGMHKQYQYTGNAVYDQRFILGAPLKLDLLKGQINAQFYEIHIKDPAYLDGAETHGTSQFKFIF